MFDEGDWSAFLSRELDRSVRVRFGRARQRVLEARPLPRGDGGTEVYEVRLSAFFSEAPPEVRDAVARWLRVGRRARKSAALLDAWIESAVESLPPSPGRRQRVQTAGISHDLSPLLADLTTPPDHLPPLDSTPSITWGRRTGVRARRSLQLGCYVAADHLIRMHPVLDQNWVPGWFVRYVLFHELLHSALPVEQDASGRTIHHGPQFRRWERRFPDYARAISWLERNLQGLLRTSSAGRGRSAGARSASSPAPAPIAVAPEPPIDSTSGPRQGLLFPA